MSASAALLRPATEKLIDLGKLGPGASVLDLGCGDGPVSVLVSSRVLPGGHVVGIDPSASAIEAARGHAANLGIGPELELRTGSLEALDLPDESINVVFSQLGLIAADHPARALSEARRVLRRAGRLVLLTLGAHERNTFVTAVHELLDNGDEGGPGIDRLFETDGAGPLQEALRRAGFVDVLTQEIRIIVRATDAWGLWSTAASVARWDDVRYPEVQAGLERLCAAPGGAHLSMEVVYASAAKPADEAELARPRSFDELTAEVRPRIRELSPFEARRGVPGKRTVFLDVREAGERSTGVVPGSVHVPRGVLETAVDEALPDGPAAVAVYSEDGRRSLLATLRLEELGYRNVWNLVGGVRAWQRYGYEVELPEPAEPPIPPTSPE